MDKEWSKDGCQSGMWHLELLGRNGSGFTTFPCALGPSKTLFMTNHPGFHETP